MILFMGNQLLKKITHRLSFFWFMLNRYLEKIHLWYPEFISVSCCEVNPYLALQIFPICEGDPLSPPEGEAAEVVSPLDPRVKLKYTNFLPSEAQKKRPSDPKSGELSHFIEYFCKMISG
jgi:hypothetical protein